MTRHTVRFEADLTDAEADAVRALGGMSVDSAVAELARVATAEWLGWLAANDRPASLTEQSKRRVKALMDANLLPRLPTAPVIAQRTRLTLGQARYIVASLALENPSGTAETRRGLAKRLEEGLVAAGIRNADQLTKEQIDALVRDPRTVQFDAPRTEAEFALALHEELLNLRFSESDRLEINKFEPPSRQRRTDSYSTLSMRPHVAVELLQALKP
jgi:hypothetical protein